MVSGEGYGIGLHSGLYLVSGPRSFVCSYKPEAVMGVVLCGVGVVLLGVLVLISPVEGALSPLVSAQGDHGTGAFMVVGDRNLNESSWQDLKSSIERLSSQGRVNCVIDGLQKVVTVQLSQPNLVKVCSFLKGLAHI